MPDDLVEVEFVGGPKDGYTIKRARRLMDAGDPWRSGYDVYVPVFESRLERQRRTGGKATDGGWTFQIKRQGGREEAGA